MKKKIFIITSIALLLVACSSGIEEQAEDQVENNSTEFVESAFENDLDQPGFESEIAENTEKKSLEETDANPIPNEKPNIEAIEAEKQEEQVPEVEKVTVTPENLDPVEETDESEESESSEESEEAGESEELPENFVRDLAYEINDPAYNGIVVDVSMVEEDADLHLIEQDLGVNITIVDGYSSNQSLLIIPRQYNGVLVINEVAYDAELVGYQITNEYLNVYMAVNDAILLNTELSTENPNIMLTYYDEQGAYKIQTLVQYSADTGSISVNNGYNFVN